MKERATIVCCQQGKLLLVERGRVRWSLPGGTVKRDETPLDAALRELSEETTIESQRLAYLFQFGGLNKRHHVFFCAVPVDIQPQASHEIVRCRWYRPAKVATLITSVPTREIVTLLLETEGSGLRVTPQAAGDSGAAMCGTRNDVTQ